ncbi:MAG: sulfite exporter TauE/SafE family protein [Clostridia bacterium]|nr:sulfite exporter TauE/SafE family protein [Clostridia bacterium]
MERGKISVREKRKLNLKSIFAGSFVGVVNGLFGGGGGMIAVPALQSTGLDEKSAHATAILVILPVSALSFLLYAFEGWVESSVLIPTSLGVFFGGILGAKLLSGMKTKWVNYLFAFLQAAAGVWMLIGK